MCNVGCALLHLLTAVQVAVAQLGQWVALRIGIWFVKGRHLPIGQLERWKPMRRDSWSGHYTDTPTRDYVDKSIGKSR